MTRMLQSICITLFYPQILSSMSKGGGVVLIPCKFTVWDACCLIRVYITWCSEIHFESMKEKIFAFTKAGGAYFNAK